MAGNRVTGKGGYNALCAVCGLKYKAADLRKRWDGAWVCESDWEPRHPQEFVRARRDNPALPWVRPDTAGADIGPTLNCNGLETETIHFSVFQGQLNSINSSPTPEYDIYKITTYGGQIHIPDGLDLHVLCTLHIGD